MEALNSSNQSEHSCDVRLDSKGYSFVREVCLLSFLGVGFLLNVLAFMALKQIIQKKGHYVIVMGLVSSNIVSNFTLLTLIPFTVRNIHNQVLFISMFPLSLSTYLVSVIHVVCISVERLVAVVKPRSYQRLFSCRRMKLTVGAVWILALTSHAVIVFTNVNVYELTSVRYLRFVMFRPYLLLYYTTGLVITFAVYIILLVCLGFKTKNVRPAEPLSVMSRSSRINTSASGIHGDTVMQSNQNAFNKRDLTDISEEKQALANGVDDVYPFVAQNDDMEDDSNLNGRNRIQNINNGSGNHDDAVQSNVFNQNQNISGQNLNIQNNNGHNNDGQSSNDHIKGQKSNGQNISGQNINGQNINGHNISGQNISGQNINGQNVNGHNINGQNINDHINGQNVNGHNINGKGNEINTKHVLFFYKRGTRTDKHTDPFDEDVLPRFEHKHDNNRLETSMTDFESNATSVTNTTTSRVYIRKLREPKAVITIGVLILVHLLTGLATLVSYGVIGEDALFHPKLFGLPVFMVAINSLFDPFFYVVSSIEVRKSVREIFKCALHDF